MNSGTLDFYELVERALEGLPREIWELLDNVAIMVDDWPAPGSLAGGYRDDAPYGFYEGVPLTERGSGYSWNMPDRISIFRGPLERDFPPEEIEEQVRITVVHEVAHHFGLDEDRLEELGYG